MFQSMSTRTFDDHERRSSRMPLLRRTHRGPTRGVGAVRPTKTKKINAPTYIFGTVCRLGHVPTTLAACVLQCPPAAAAPVSKHASEQVNVCCVAFAQFDDVAPGGQTTDLCAPPHARTTGPRGAHVWCVVKPTKSRRLLLQQNQTRIVTKGMTREHHVHQC